MSGGFFRGTSADQDTRFSNKQAKLLKSQKFSPVLDQLVDMTKVKMDVMKPWIATRATELVGFEDEVLINFIYGLLDGKGVDGKQIQIQLTGFMEKNTGKFMRELWSLLLSAQSNVSGVPQQFLDAKEEETRKKKEESDKITQEIQKRMDRDGRRPEKERRSRFGDEADLSKFTKDASGGVGSKFSEPRDSSMEHVDGEADKRHGLLSENRRSRTPPLKRRTPSPQTIPSPTRSNDKKSMSRSRSISEERPKRRSPVSSQSPKHSISPKKRYLSPKRRSISPRKRYLSPNRRSISPRKRYSSPNRRSFSPRRRYRSPHRSRYRSPRDSRSPPRRRSTYLRQRSPSPYRGRSPIPRRRSPRRISPSPARRRSPSPARRRSPSPARRRLSPVRRVSPSPVRSISPSPVHSISPSPVRRRSPPLQHRSPKKYRRSPSPSLSPLPRSPKRRGSPYKSRSSLSPSRRSPLSRSSRHRELSPMRSPGHHHADSSLSPSQRKRSPSPYRSRSNISLSTKHDDRLNDGKITERGDVKKSPAKVSASVSHKMQISLLSPQCKSKIEKKSPIASPELSLNRSVSPTDVRKEDGRIRRSCRSPNLSRSPIRKTRKEEHMNHDREVTHNRIARSGRTGKDSPTPRDMKPEPYSPKRKNFSRSPELRNDKRRKSEAGPVDKHAETHNPSAVDNAAGKARHERGSGEHANERRSSEQLRKMDDESYDTKQQKRGNGPRQAALPKNRTDSDSEDSYKKDRRSKRSDNKHKGGGEETSESDSEAEHRKEAKRKRREEKRLRREERHKKREERHRRKLERRAGKLKLRSTEGDASGADDSEAEQKRLEIVLREKALESLRAKKGISH